MSCVDCAYGSVSASGQLDILYQHRNSSHFQHRRQLDQATCVLKAIGNNVFRRPDITEAEPQTWPKPCYAGEIIQTLIAQADNKQHLKTARHG